MKPKFSNIFGFAAPVIAFAGMISPALADINWDGDNAVGNFSNSDNWYGNTLPGWGFGSGNLVFNYRNNTSQTSLYYDLGAWNDINDIIFESTFTGPITFNGDDNGINFNQRLENRSSSTVTIGTLKLSGGKNGATQIELNPVNGDLILNGTIYNDNSKSYVVYGNNGKKLTVGTTLGVGSTASAVSFTLAENSIVNFTTNQTFAGGLVIKAGTVVGDANGGNLNTIFGTGTIKIGDSATGANATLTEAGFGSNIANAITVDSGAGTRNLVSSSNNSGQIPQFTGGITLNNTLTLSATSFGGMRINGVINDGAGTNGLIIDGAGSGSVRLNQTNTFDGGVVIKRGILEQNTVAAALGSGTVTIGDSSGSNNATLLASGTGFTATNAITVAAGNTGTNSIQANSGNSFIYSGNVTLNNNLNLGALSTGNLTLSGGIASASGTKTITNAGTGTGSVTLNTGIISNAAGTLNIVQNSAGSTLYLLGANTFTGGITLKSGKISVNTTAGLGATANVVTLGDSSGAAVTLEIYGQSETNASNLDQAVNVTGTGTNTISGTWNNSGQINLLRGAITLNSTNLTINSTAASGWRVQAGVTGTGNLTIKANGTGSIDMRTVAFNNVGTITNSGTGTGVFQQGSAISFGANVTSLIQNSTTSNWNINQANANFVGTVQALAGKVSLNSTSSLKSANEVLVASGATLEVLQSNTIAGLSNVSGSGGTVTNTDTVNARTLTLGGSGTYSFSGAITATTLANMAVTKSGAGTQTLSGSSNYAGGTTISGGTLKAGNASAFGTGAIALSNASGTLDLNAQSIGNTLNISAAGSLINSSASAAALTADANVTSDFTVNTNGNITATRLIGTGAIRTITKTGAGTLTTNGTSHNNLTAWLINQGTVVFANTSGYGADRGVTIAGGTLKLSGANFDLINNGEAFTINSGVFDLNGKAEAVASISGSGGTVRNTNAAAAALYVGGGISGTSSASYGGVIENGTGTLALTKEGTGTQTLTGTNTYTGATSVNNGKLLVSGSIGSSAVTVTGTGSTLASGTTGTIGSSVTINTGAILAAGDVNAIGTATVNGGTTLNSGIFSWDIDTSLTQTAGTGYDNVVTSSLGGSSAVFAVVLKSGQSFSDTFWNATRTWENIFSTDGSAANALGMSSVFSSFTYNGNVSAPVDGAFTFIDGGKTLKWTAVPEPTTALAGLLIGAGLLRRRRN